MLLQSIFKKENEHFTFRFGSSVYITLIFVCFLIEFCSELFTTNKCKFLEMNLNFGHFCHAHFLIHKHTLSLSFHLVPISTLIPTGEIPETPEQKLPKLRFNRSINLYSTNLLLLPFFVFESLFLLFFPFLLLFFIYVCVIDELRIAY